MRTKKNAYDLKKRRGLSMWDFVAKDAASRIGGVHFQEGDVVASDAFMILILTNQDYPSEMEGRTITKSGLDTRQRYPHYKGLCIEDYFSNEEIEPEWDKWKEDCRIAGRMVRPIHIKRLCRLNQQWGIDKITIGKRSFYFYGHDFMGECMFILNHSIYGL